MLKVQDLKIMVLNITLSTTIQKQITIFGECLLKIMKRINLIDIIVILKKKMVHLINIQNKICKILEKQVYTQREDLSH